MADSAPQEQGKIRVLHVDDEPDQLLFARTLLEDADPGIQVESVKSPFEALDRLASCDCLLTDYQMPDMDGVEFARKAKQIVDVPVILYTGRGSEEVASAAFAAGANDYLRKEMDPGHYQVLARRIRHAVESQRIERALRESEERYRVLLDSNSDAVYVVTDNAIAYMNQRGAEILGYANPSELTGRDIEKFIAPEDLERIYGYTKLRFNGGSPPNRYELHLIHADGSRIEVENNVTIIEYRGKKSSLVVSRDITERKRLEKQLQASEGRYRSFLDDQADAIFVLDTERYLYTNQAAANLLGYTSPQDLIGLPSFSIVAPEDRDEVRRRTGARAQFIPVPDKYEIKLLRRDGGTVETEVHVSLIDYEGKPASLGVHRDITERKKMEAELSASEERYRTVIDASIDAIYVIQDGKYIYVNQRGVELLGYEEPSDLLGHEILEFFHPDEKMRIAGYVRGRNRGEKQPTEYVTKIIRRDGSTRSIETKVAIINFGGTPSTLAIGRDVTEREETAEALRESEAEKTTLLSTIPDGLSLIDREYRYQWTNELEASRVGMKPEELIGKPCFSVFNDRKSPCHTCLVPKVFETGEPENWTSTDSRGKIWRIMANPIKNADGSVTSVIVLSRDITEIQRSQNRTNALHTSTLKLDASSTEEEVWDVVFDALTGVLGYKQTGIGIVEDDYVKFKARYRVVKLDNFLPLSGKGVTLRALRTLKTQMVADTLRDEDYVPADPHHPENVFRSELVVPVNVDGVGVAALNAESKSVDGFDENDRKLLEILASYASQAVKRIRQVNQLKESEEKYRQLAENAADVLFVVALDGTITYTSREVNPHVGFTREEIVGRNIADFLPPSEVEILLKLFGEATLTEAWNPLVLEISKKNGGFAVLEFNPSPIHSEGKITAIQVVVRDVSSRIDLQRKLNALHMSALRLSETEDLAHVWEIAVDTLRSVLGFRRADIGVIEGNSIRFSHGLNKEHPELVLPLSGQGITVRAVKTMQTQLIRDVSKDESYIPGIENPMKYASELVVPVVADGGVAAVINLEEARLDAFAEEDVHLAETLALHIASTVSRLRHAELDKREKTRLAALHASSVRLSAASTVDDVWRLVFEDLRTSMGFDMTGVGIVGDGVIRFTRGTSHFPADFFEILLNIRSITTRAVKTKETQYVSNTREDPDYVEGPRREGVEPYSAEIAVPVVVEGKTIAVLNVETSKPESLSEVDARLMETLALHAATAVSRLRQREDEGRYRQRLEILNKHANDLEEVESLQDALRLTYDSLVVLGLMSPSISLLQNDVLFVPPIEGRNSVSPMSLPISGPGITVRAAKTKKTQLLNDAASDPDLVPSPEGLHIGSELVVPMKIGDGVIGVLNLESVEQNAYTEEDARIVEMLAAHVSSTLNRLQILEGLHREVEERTSALLSAEQMAAAGRVSAMVAHDLRGPLQTISSASRLVRMKPEKTTEMLGHIDSAVERSIRMLEDLRLNTREEPLRLAPTDLPSLVSQAIKELPSVEGVGFEIRMGEGLESVQVDPLKIRRVLDNLFRNAIEAMPGGGKIAVAAVRSDGKVTLEVSDSGKGIPPEIVGRLFRPFSTTKTGGLGLGLTYCKKAVEDHGGSIMARNAEGGGAVFTIRLPAPRVE